MMVYANLNKVAEEICLKGFATVQVEDMKEKLLLADKGFEQVLSHQWLRMLYTIPEKHYLHDELGEPFEIGLLQKKHGEQKNSDNIGFFDNASGRKYNDANKERFHYADSLLTFLPKNHGSDFLDSVKFFNTRARDLTYRIMFELMKNFQFISVVDDPESLIHRCNQMVVITRLIRYGAVTGLQPDAQVHRDRDFITVHHYASHCGLRVFDKQHVSHATTETDTTSVTVFTGEKFWGVTRGIFGTGAPHGVLDERRKQALGDDTPRFVAVSFVHFPLTAGDCVWMKDHMADLKIDQSLYHMM